MKLRAAFYLRVSTDEQSAGMQMPPLEQLAGERGWEVVARLEETVSASAARRPQLEALLQLAHRRKIDVVAVWALDRLGRSFYGNLDIVRQLEESGVAVVSVRDSWLDSTSLPAMFRGLFIGLLSAIAEHETKRRGERTREGLAHARAHGIRLGRIPRFNEFTTQKLLELRGQGWSWESLAKHFGVSKATVRRRGAGVKKGA